MNLKNKHIQRIKFGVNAPVTDCTEMHRFACIFFRQHVLYLLLYFRPAAKKRTQRVIPAGVESMHSRPLCVRGSSRKNYIRVVDSFFLFVFCGSVSYTSHVCLFVLKAVRIWYNTRPILDNKVSFGKTRVHLRRYIFFQRTKIVYTG